MHCIFYSRNAVRSEGKRLWEIRDGSLTHRTVQLLSRCILHKCTAKKECARAGKMRKRKDLWKTTDYYTQGNVLITIIDNNGCQLYLHFCTDARINWSDYKSGRNIDYFYLSITIILIFTCNCYFLLFVSCHRWLVTNSRDLFISFCYILQATWTWLCCRVYSAYSVKLCSPAIDKIAKIFQRQRIRLYGMHVNVNWRFLAVLLRRWHICACHLNNRVPIEKFLPWEDITCRSSAVCTPTPSPLCARNLPSFVISVRIWTSRDPNYDSFHSRTVREEARVLNFLPLIDALL